MSKVFADVLLVLICFYVGAFAWSWGPLGWLVPSECFSLEIRLAGQAITIAVNLLFTFIIAQCFLTMLCHLKFGLFFFFAGFVLMMTVFIFFFVPETKNVPLEEMNSVEEIIGSGGGLFLMMNNKIIYLVGRSTLSINLRR